MCLLNNDNVKVPIDSHTSATSYAPIVTSKLLITSKYKKTDKHIATNINKEGIKHANIIDRIEINGTDNSFITLKDHKENFLNWATSRLINPAKNEIGK